MLVIVITKGHLLWYTVLINVISNICVYLLFHAKMAALKQAYQIDFHGLWVLSHRLYGKERTISFSSVREVRGREQTQLRSSKFRIVLMCKHS